MSIKTYASAHRNHTIVMMAGEMHGGPKGRVIKFSRGLYTTADPAEQEVVEGSKLWKKSITLLKEELTKEEVAAQRAAAKAAEAEARAAAQVTAPPVPPPAPKGKK